MDIECDKGHTYKSSIDNFRHGNRCPHCDLIVRKVSQLIPYEVVKKEFEDKGYTLLSEVYDGNNKPLDVECPKGHKWRVSLSNFRKGHRCKRCSRSRGEHAIMMVLEHFNIPFENEYTIPEKGFSQLRFDFYLPEENMTIEYDGEFHYMELGINNLEEIQRCDRRKDELCRMKNIKMLRIPYWDYKNIEDILAKELNLIICDGEIIY